MELFMNTIHHNLSARYIAALLVFATTYLPAPIATFATVIADQSAVVKAPALVEQRSLLTPDGDPCQSVEHVVAWYGVTTSSCDTYTRRDWTP